MTPPTSGPPATDTPRAPLRRDAERNRRRILDAAARLVVEHGLAVPLEDVAREAGVGIGTLYRRFADRDTLVRALFEDHVEAVVALAQEALAAGHDGDGVERFLTASAEHHAAERGLSQILRSGPLGGELARYAGRRITPLAERLLARAHAAGTLAPTIGPGDLVLVELMVSAVQHAAAQDPAGPTDDTSWRRALALALAGLRARPAPDGAAPDTTAIDRLQRRPRG